MSPSLSTEMAAVSADALSVLVESVKADPAPVVTSVRESVERSQQDKNNCMMGGWTS